MPTTQSPASSATLATGWNTWNSRSVLSHVLLPEGFSINLAIRDYWHPHYLKESLIGNERKTGEKVIAGPRTFDGAFTELQLEWQNVRIKVQSVTAGDDLLLLITPDPTPGKRASVVVESGLQWNRPGQLALADDTLVATLPSKTITVYSTATPIADLYVQTQTPFLVLDLATPVGICTGRRRSLAEIQSAIQFARATCVGRRDDFAPHSDVYDASQRCLAWNTIYDPGNDRVITPVSRVWNNHFGGYVIFCWDTYFAAYQLAMESKPLAYANAIAMTRQITPEGFVPCWACGTGAKTLDRSNPPVGSFAVREIYRRHREKWFLNEVYPDLLTWNRWWASHRVHEGYLCLGSDPYQPRVGHWEELNGPGKLQGALFEAALDNSPMYDGVEFDDQRHGMKLADVGLLSLYILDCTALADIAGALGKADDQQELLARAAQFRLRLPDFWDEQAGIYCNIDLTTHRLSPRTSPTSFYPLFTGGVPANNARRMVDEHLMVPSRFGGEWVLPSISRDDPAYPDQKYWRGKIWPPMNFLTYLGLKQASPQAVVDRILLNNNAIGNREQKADFPKSENRSLYPVRNPLVVWPLSSVAASFCEVWFVFVGVGRGWPRWRLVAPQHSRG